MSEPRKKPALRWESFGALIDDKTAPSAPNLLRAKVPGGWLVRESHNSLRGEVALGLVYVPDPEHVWALDE